MEPIVLTQLATGLSVLAGAVLVKSVMNQKPMAGPMCSSCNGTGRVACLCSRWSDRDVGCRTCSGSGRMACSSCGGTGTGRPIPVQISMRKLIHSKSTNLRMMINMPLPNPFVSFGAMISGVRLSQFMWRIMYELDARQVVRFPLSKKVTSKP
ncbi:hypothetical protein SADUNF_Sadunf01G0043400 [Salix dunnii]|uniref:Uncharacterized protein n=1 Tax=Salix dunnii TaxID=1413687 RepID=A0A835N9I0_9ROSI|nr:hypothetical protein SADUNF_Sadunf01G0043400 [Salix dunnii]